MPKNWNGEAARSCLGAGAAIASDAVETARNEVRRILNQQELARWRREWKKNKDLDCWKSDY